MDVHPEADVSPARRELRRGGKRSLALLTVLVVVWGLLMRQFGGGDVYAVMGPFGLVVCVAIRLLRGQSLAAWFRPGVRAMAVGLGLGVLMTALTYPAFRLANELFPQLFREVQSLYADASTRSFASAMAWVAVLVVAEELLWRGALLEVLERRIGFQAAFAISVLTYAVAQLGSGSWIVFLLALVCGTVWTIERRYTRSLLAPTLTHMIWTQTVILLHPVTQ